MNRLRALLSCTLLCLALGGCGGGDDDDEATKDTQPLDCKARPDLCV